MNFSFKTTTIARKATLLVAYFALVTLAVVKQVPDASAQTLSKSHDHSGHHETREPLANIDFETTSDLDQPSFADRIRESEAATPLSALLVAQESAAVNRISDQFVILDDPNEPPVSVWLDDLSVTPLFSPMVSEWPEGIVSTPELSEGDDPQSAAAKKLKPSSNITVEIQSDFAWFGQDENNIATVGEIPDGAFFRRSRFGVFGELYETVEYRLEYDFAGDARPRFLDNWIALTNIPIVRNIIVGHFFEPFSLERYSPNRFITFNERSLADTFAPARGMGAMLYGNALQERVTFALGGFRSTTDDYGDDVSLEPGYAVTSHATLLPWFKELNDHQLSLLHLGGSLSYRLPGDDPVRYASRPSARMRQQGVGGVPLFVDTGDITDVRHTVLYGLESAWVHGPFSVQAEWILSEVNRRDDSNLGFQGGYVYGSWFLTGESRSYSPTSILGRFREGIFQRTIPKKNVFDRSEGLGWTGCGAIELAVRWAYIDLNHQDIRGGSMEEITYGLNWYLNPYTKTMFNFVRPILSDPMMGNSTADMFTVRLQFEY